MLHPAFAARQRTRWMRPDPSRWLRPDAAKFLKPGSDPADVFPALVSRRESVRRVHEYEMDAALAHERVVLDGLRNDLAVVKSDLAWRRLVDALARKYSPNQPRVPAGQTGGGQWTSGGSGSGRPRVIISTTDFEEEGEGGGEDFGSFDDGDDVFADSFDGDFGFDEIDGRFDDNDSRPSAVDRDNDHDRSDEQPRRISDIRVISDADPEPVRSGERYAQNIRDVFDANGNPYYARGGHHEMVKEVYEKWDLQPETRQVFKSATTGSLERGSGGPAAPKGHLWDGRNGAHGRYNDAVAELSDDFLRRNNLSPEQMTPKHAEDLLAEIRRSEDPRIRDFNRAIRLLRRALRFGRSE